MRSILLAADTRPGFTGRLETALDISRAFASHLTVQIDTPLAQFVVNDMYGATIIATQAMKDAQDAGVALGHRLDHLLAGQDIPFDIDERIEDPVDGLREAALLADLAIARLSAQWLGELLMGTSCPVLALPDTARPIRLTGVACIAWDGSAPAARAVRGAVPLLRRCEEVHVLTVGAPTTRDFPDEGVLRYLSRHDVHAQFHALDRNLSIEETLSAYARRLDAGWMVMGAYGHSRLREYLVGGVTRYFLTSGSLPLLLAH